MILRTQNERDLEKEIKRLKIQLQGYKEKDLLEMQRLEELMLRLHDVEFRRDVAQNKAVYSTLLAIFVAVLSGATLVVFIC